MKFIHSAVIAALLATGGAQAQMKMPPPPSDAGTPPPGVQAAPPGGPPNGGNVVQPNMPDPVSKEFRACVQKVQQGAQQNGKPDLVAAQACFVAETKRQEVKITTGIQRVASQLTANERKHLDESNVAWRRFRDTECAFFAEPKGTPEEVTTNAQCVMDHTIKRALDLGGLSLALSEREAEKKAAAASPAPAAPAKK